MRKTLLAATAASALTVGLVTPASAMNWDDDYTPLTVGSSDETVKYKFAWDEEKPGNSRRQSLRIKKESRSATARTLQLMISCGPLETDAAPTRLLCR